MKWCDNMIGPVCSSCWTGTMFSYVAIINTERRVCKLLYWTNCGLLPEGVKKLIIPLKQTCLCCQASPAGCNDGLLGYLSREWSAWDSRPTEKKFKMKTWGMPDRSGRQHERWQKGWKLEQKERACVIVVGLLCVWTFKEVVLEYLIVWGWKRIHITPRHGDNVYVVYLISLENQTSHGCVPPGLRTVGKYDFCGFGGMNLLNLLLICGNLAYKPRLSTPRSAVRVFGSAQRNVFPMCSTLTKWRVPAAGCSDEKKKTTLERLICLFWSWAADSKLLYTSNTHMCTTCMLPVLLLAVLTSTKVEPDEPQKTWKVVTVAVSEAYLCQLCCWELSAGVNSFYMCMHGQVWIHLNRNITSGKQKAATWRKSMMGTLASELRGRPPVNLKSIKRDMRGLPGRSWIWGTQVNLKPAETITQTIYMSL